MGKKKASKSSSSSSSMSIPPTDPSVPPKIPEGHANAVYGECHRQAVEKLLVEDAKVSAEQIWEKLGWNRCQDPDVVPFGTFSNWFKRQKAAYISKLMPSNGDAARAQVAQFSGGSTPATGSSPGTKEEKNEEDVGSDDDFDDFEEPKRTVLPFGARWKITEEHFIVFQMANDKTWTVTAQVDALCKSIWLTCQRKAPERTHFQELIVKSELPFTEEEEKEMIGDLETLDTRQVFKFPCPEGSTWEPTKENWQIRKFTTQPKQVVRSEKKMTRIRSPIQKWRMLAIPIVKPRVVESAPVDISDDESSSEEDPSDKAFMKQLCKLVGKENRSKLLVALRGNKKSQKKKNVSFQTPDSVDDGSADEEMPAELEEEASEDSPTDPETGEQEDMLTPALANSPLRPNKRRGVLRKQV